ncbi:MAG TPA: AsmA family protein [Parafilimonas sp.]|nr:AsmA family protein [Parafilimonas sp.]
MKIFIKRSIRKILKITSITIGSILLLMFVLPILFPDFVAGKIKLWANNAITTKLDFSKARLSFFNHFPSLTLTLYDVSLMGSEPYPTDTLLNAHEVALGIDLSTVFSSRIRIDEIFFTKGLINIKVDENGSANYNVYKPDTTATTSTNDTTGASLKIERIQIDKSDLAYDDLSIPFLITAQNLNYVGKGDLSKSVFDLASHIAVQRFDLDYNFAHYIDSKKIEANLVTRINTSSLAFEFIKNNLLINTLPVDLTGKLEFLEKGYNMDFELVSNKGDLHDVFSALPPEYADWLDKTKADGKVQMNAYLKGKYDADKNIMPDLGFTMQVRNGYINNQHAPSPVKNLFLNFDSKLPGLDTDSLYLNIDSIFFNIDKDYFSAIIKLNNLNKPTVHAKINSEMDLEKWDKAFGVEPFNVKGYYKLHFTANGSYQTAVVKKGIRTSDTVITSIPAFNLQSSLSNGYFKYTSLPQPVSNISFNLNASCTDGDYEHTKISVENINANMLSDYVKGFVRINNLKNFTVDANLKSLLHLDNIRKYYPLDSVQVGGNLNVDIVSKGNYLPDKKQFPVTQADIRLQNGYIQTVYYPHPVKKISVAASITNSDGTLRGSKFELQPVAFEFEGESFTLKADLKNFEDIKYDVTSKGTIDIGRIYQVFSQKGLDVTGQIKTDIVLQGLQSDAAAKRFGRLHNAGTASLKDITLRSDYFPKPFIIKTGLFRFVNDKMYFDEFKANYGKTDITLNGYLSNIINYTLEDNAVLSGNFDLQTNYFYADEFAAFAGDTAAAQATDTVGSGVVIIPSNLDLTFNAMVKTVEYDSLRLNDFKGSMSINNGKLILKETGFTLIDAPVVMDATYYSLSPHRAFFDYHISAKEFDIKRAYNEIKIFHDLASAASKAEGIVSLDYRLNGKLDQNMEPVYPSLKGGGVLSIKDVKLDGFKLMSAVSKATEKDSIDNPNLKAVKVKTTIANNIITLERTKLRVFGFRPRFEGQTSFDGRLNLTGRLGLPPFGIFGIPFTVTGTQENPQVHLRRAKDSDKIEMTEEPADIDDQQQQ